MDRLKEKCATRFTDEEMSLLIKAMGFAKKVHASQKRASGEPYYIHPEAVALLLFEMGMDAQTVIAGLLHDVVEDGENISVKMITEEFGEDIATMVDGVTKLTQSSFTTIATREEQHAENLRKMFLAIANDVRVVIIKLSDRLHNMRTLQYCTHDKQMRKARETLEVYAPLAHRFGIGAIKGELEDLAFAYLYPDEFKKLHDLIAPQQQEREKLLESAMETIGQQLEGADIKAHISGRPKHIYSIYRKINKLNSTINDIYDLVAVRVIVDTVNDCYAALGVIHSLWKPMPGRFKDYIAMPKPNMYRSLHTTLFSSVGIPFEVQIRTYEMHRAAEYGIAAHWMYKEGRTGQDDLDSKLVWLRQALEYESDADTTREFVDNICKDFFSDYVFVLTPKGEIIDLPIGSTPLDFAYRIHTNIGHHTQHARVNGVMARLDYQLKTNDVVEIVTSSSQQGPSRDWLKVVKTQQAKAKIRQWFKKANREENIQKGREMLTDAVRRQGYLLGELLTPESLAELFKRYNIPDMEGIYAAIGYGGLATNQVVHKMLEQYRKERKAAELAQRLEQKEQEQKPIRHGSGRGVIVEGEPNMMVRFALCCSPLPGDEIVGYVTRGRGVSVHKRDCTNFNTLALEGDRIIGVKWASNEQSSYTANIQIMGVDRPGLIMDISQALLSMNVSPRTINAKTDRDNYVTAQLSFDVSNTSQLDSIIKKLRKVQSVSEVYRSSAQTI